MAGRKHPTHRGDYGHKKWLRPPVPQIAFAIEPREVECNYEKPLTFVFHGASCVKMVNYVFGLLCGTLFQDYSCKEEIATQFLNGKCWQTYVVEITKPDEHRLSISEWPTIITYMLEKRFRCKVTFYKNYEKFLND